MKLILLALPLCFAAAATAQPPVKKQIAKKPAATLTPQTGDAALIDSLATVTQPRVQNAPTASRTRQPNKTKLDDLKNPFDTTKVMQKQPSNFSWGASNPTGAPQNQRTRKTPVTNQRWIDDSLLWIKNKQQPIQKNIPGQAGNTRSGRPQKVTKPGSLGVAPVQPAVQLKKQ